MENTTGHQNKTVQVMDGVAIFTMETLTRFSRQIYNEFAW